MKIRLFNFTKNTVLKLFVLAFVLISVDIKSQCMPTVPSFTINLTGQPAGIWSSPNVSRNDQCCSATSPDQCIYFNLTLDPNSAGIQIDMIGADPAGSLFYDIGCTGNYPGGQIKCISGVGPHEITFCKPGGNKNVYKITSISKPLFPADDTVRIGCKKKLVTLGIVNNTTTWTAVNSSSGSAPALLTTINGYLDSLNVASPTYSPATGAPNWVEYQVCGFPIASGCGFSLTVCDIVRVYNYPKLTAGVTPTLATYCSPATGVVLTGTASGGLAPYTYSWTQTPSTVVLGTGNTFTASGNGLFNLIVADKLYDPNNCPAFYASRSVSQGTIPVAIAPPSKKVCASTPSAALSGTVQYQTSMFWSGGNGSYIPSSNVPNITYSPSAAEVAVGSVKLYINAIGGNGCSNKKDSLWLYFSPTLTTSISSGTLACHNSITTLTANVSGGTMPYSYLWNTSATTNTILAGQGNYNVMVNDSLGCAGNANLNVVAPTALSMIFNVSNVTINGGNDGSATVTPSGGAPAYSVTWTPGGMNTMAINTLTYGVYTAKIVDANGCELEASTIVNEPRCLLFTSALSATNVK
ncbi:MAG: SprB repeat-containing protein [Bacteroidia bacterium]